MPVVKIPLSDVFSMRDTRQGVVNAYQRDTMFETFMGELTVRTRPSVGPNFPNDSTGLAGTPGGLTQYAGNTYAVVNDTFTQVNVGVTGASGTAWTQDSLAAGWAGRSAFDAVSFNGAIYIVGGRTQSVPSAQGDVWMSKDGGVTWGLVTSSAPFGARYGHRVVVFNGAMYLLGGYYQTSGFAANDTWMTTDGTNWTQVNGGAVSFPPRAFFGAVATAGGIYVMGGTDGANIAAGTSKNDVWFSADGINWAVVTNAAAWSVRCDFDVVNYNNLLVLVGGVDSTTHVATNQCWTSADGLLWTQATTNALSAGTNSGVRLLVYAGKMWALGGFFYTGGTTPGNVYSSTNPNAWAFVGSSALLQTDDAAVCVSGINPSQNPSRLSSMFYIGGLSSGGGASSSTANAVLNVSFASIPLGPSVAGQPYQFETFKNGACLLIKNQSNMWVFEGGVVTKVTDKRYPSVTVPGLVVLGGFAYVMDPSGLIVNCDFNNPQYWPGQNYIGADYDADGGQCINKLQNYLVAFGPNSAQLFYDAGTPVGSPLLPYLAANQRFGCCDPLSVVNIDGRLFWYGQDETGQRGIATFNGLRAQVISPQAENLVLNTYAGNYLGNTPTFIAMGIASGSHKFYVYPLDLGGLQDAHGSLVYDLTTQRWQFWTPGSMPGFTTTAFPFQSSTLANGESSTQPATLLLDQSGSTIYKITEDASNDQVGFIGYRIPAVVQTNLFDGGNNRMKAWGRLDLVCDQLNDGGSSTMNVQVTEDWMTYSAARSFVCSSPRPSLFRWGASRKRAWKITMNANLLICRLRHLECEYEQGT